jgi:plasmid stability protein
LWQILIRMVAPELKLTLERRAKHNNRTIEAEVCEIIRTAMDKKDTAMEVRAKR